MGQRHLGFAIVPSPEGMPMGIVTEWDMLAKVVAQGRDPSHVRLADVMSTQLASVGPNEGSDRVAQLMAAKGTRRVLVVNSKVLGVIRVKTILARLRDYIDTISTNRAHPDAALLNRRSCGIDEPGPPSASSAGTGLGRRRNRSRGPPRGVSPRAGVLQG